MYGDGAFFSPWCDIKDSAQILGSCMFLLFDDGSQQVLFFCLR